VSDRHNALGMAALRAAAEWMNGAARQYRDGLPPGARPRVADIRRHGQAPRLSYDRAGLGAFSASMAGAPDPLDHRTLAATGRPTLTRTPRTCLSRPR